MDKILSDTEFLLNDYNPVWLAGLIVDQMKQQRLALNYTQAELAERSGVSFGSVKRFESKHEISLKHLLQIAVALDSTEEFKHLFSEKRYRSLSEMRHADKLKERKRARRNG